MHQATLALPAAPSHEEMSRAFYERDASYDGLFVAGVRTTGIFCSPSCPARKPDPRNVTFYPTAGEALFAGYRPCLRCKPMERADSLPDWAVTLLHAVEEHPERPIRARELMEMGLDPGRVRRLFRRRFGMSFAAYCRARRLGQAFERIRRGAGLDDAVADHGFASHSGMREAFARLFGTTPGRAREAEAIRLGWIETPLGPMIAGATDAGLCLLEFTDRRMLETQVATVTRRLGMAAYPAADDGHLAALRDQLDEYWSGERREFDLPLVTPGTAFQQRVWDALRRIPYGETRSYGELATTLGKPGAMRAVGLANGQNRIAIVIPCHRVVRGDGTIGGYGGGLWRKHRLLALERGQGLRDE